MESPIPVPDFARFLRFFGAVELLEDLLDFLLVHADALVLHGDTDVAFSRVAPATVTSVRWRRVLDGVGKQIVEGVLHQFAVAGELSSCSGSDRRWMPICLRSASGRTRSTQALIISRHREVLLLQLHLAGGEPLDVEKHLDHARQALGFRIDQLRHLLALLFGAVGSARSARSIPGWR